VGLVWLRWLGWLRRVVNRSKQSGILKGLVCLLVI